MAYSIKLVQNAISDIEKMYNLPILDRRLTLAHIIEDPLTTIGKPIVAQHLITLAKANGIDETDPVVMALQDAKDYLEKSERWK
ncbi:MAG: hypothetical protein AABW84_00175 [Nanoarchaeota archaeon]